MGPLRRSGGHRNPGPSWHGKFVPLDALHLNWGKGTVSLVSRKEPWQAALGSGRRRKDGDNARSNLKAPRRDNTR